MTDEDRDNAENENEEEDQLAGRTPEDRAKEVGRDGAYLEANSKDLVKLMRSGDLDLASMIVIRDSRLDLSSEEHVEGLKEAVKEAFSDSSTEVAGMDDEQISFYVFRTIFERGLESIAEKGVDASDQE